MWVCTQAFHVPKHGNAEDEYEDAFFPATVFKRGLTDYRCAVADGATESAFSGPWAQLLVRGFGRGRLRLDRLKKRWQRYVGRRKSLPWYVQAKLSKGAHAALCGLRLRDVPGRSPPGGRWRVLAIGDSCAFHVRGDKLVAKGPIAKAKDFDNSPFLVSTNGAGDISRHADHVKLMKGAWRSRDVFYLATDAIACWILAEVEAGRPPWSMLQALGEPGCRSFAEIVAELRETGAMRNDDTTLLRVEVA